MKDYLFKVRLKTTIYLDIDSGGWGEAKPKYTKNIMVLKKGLTLYIKKEYDDELSMVEFVGYTQRGKSVIVFETIEELIRFPYFVFVFEGFTGVVADTLIIDDPLVSLDDVMKGRSKE